MNRMKPWHVVAIVLCVLLLAAAVCWKLGVLNLPFLDEALGITRERLMPVPSEAPQYTEPPVIPTTVPIPTDIPTPVPTEVPTPVPTAVPTSAPTQAPATPDSDMERALMVNLTDEAVKNLYTEISMVWLQNSAVSTDRDRLAATGLSDAVSFPLDENPEKAYHQIIEEVLRSPVYGDMVARALDSIPLSSGKTIRELNPWLGGFIDQTNGYYTATSHPIGLENWLTYRYGADGQVDTSTIYVTGAYRAYAVRLVVLLDRLVNKGWHNYLSLANYCLNYTADDCYRRTELATYQEDKDSLIFAFWQKDERSEFLIGFNKLDRRIEIFSVRREDPVDPDPDPDPDPTPTPVPTERPTKNPDADPANQGNAPIGGGTNQENDGSGKLQTTRPPTTAPTATPSPAPTTAPTPEPKATPVTTFKSNTVETLKPQDSIALDVASGQTIVVTGEEVVGGYLDPSLIP